MDEKAKIFVGMPVYGSVPELCFARFGQFLLKTQRDYKIYFHTITSTFLCTARNNIAEAFLKNTDADYLLFLDQDMLIPMNLIELLKEHNKGIVSALYYGKNETPQLPTFMVKKDGEYKRVEKFPKNSLIKVDAIGLGACLIKREVMEKISETLGDEPFFKFSYPSRLKEIGEDIYFCELAKKAGYEIYVDTRFAVGHVGAVTTGDFENPRE